MKRGAARVLKDGEQVCLDFKHGRSAIFTFQAEGGAMDQFSQQGGYGQQGQYPQGPYAQQQGGYPPPQHGGYPPQTYPPQSW